MSEQDWTEFRISAKEDPHKLASTICGRIISRQKQGKPVRVRMIGSGSAIEVMTKASMTITQEFGDVLHKILEPTSYFTDESHDGLKPFNKLTPDNLMWLMRGKKRTSMDEITCEQRFMELTSMRIQPALKIEFSSGLVDDTRHYGYQRPQIPVKVMQKGGNNGRPKPTRSKPVPGQQYHHHPSYPPHQGAQAFAPQTMMMAPSFEATRASKDDRPWKQQQQPADFQGRTSPPSHAFGLQSAVGLSDNSLLDAIKMDETFDNGCGGGVVDFPSPDLDMLSESPCDGGSDTFKPEDAQVNEFRLGQAPATKSDDDDDDDADEFMISRIN